MSSNRSNSELAPPPREGAHRRGDVIAGRYVLDRSIGAGGMGVVWVARSKALDVDVALKLLHAPATNRIAVERMAREAHAAARLGHAAIVRVLDFGETESGQPFMAMELLEGEDLGSVLARQGCVTAVQAVSLLLPAIDGLSAAHRHGIVHRDLKPENIFVARDEFGRVEPKVLDFGIAKLDVGTEKRLTQMGAVLGSPAYLSPEQAEGAEDVDCRTDIWSIGVVLYHLVTGRLPFDGRNYNALIRSITQDQPRAALELSKSDDALWKIVGKCLRKDPSERFESMRALGVALAGWLVDRGVTVDASSRSVRDVWLEGGVSSVRGLFGSRPPGAARPGAGNRAADLGFGTTRIRAKSGARTGPSPRLAWLAALVLSLVGAVAWRLGREAAPAPSPGSVPSRSVTAETAGSRVAPPPQPTELAPHAEASTAAPSAESPSKPRAAAARPASDLKRAPPGVKPKVAPRPKGVDTEFGF